jgi:hypothetical protein
MHVALDGHIIPIVGIVGWRVQTDIQGPVRREDEQFILVVVAENELLTQAILDAGVVVEKEVSS